MKLAPSESVVWVRLHGLTEEKAIRIACRPTPSGASRGRYSLEASLAKNQKCGRCNTVGHNRRRCGTPAKATVRGSVIEQRILAKLAELQALERVLDDSVGVKTNEPAKGDIDPTGGTFCPKVPDRFGGPTRQSVVAKGAKTPLPCNFCGVWLVSPGSLKTHVGLMKQAMRATTAH